MGLLVGLGSAAALVAVSATDASAGCRRIRTCGAYAPAPVYQYAPPPVYYAPPPAAYYAPPPAAVYTAPAYGYVPAAGYGYRNCDRGNGYGYNGYGYNGYGYGNSYNGYGNGYNGYGYGNGYGYAPPVAYDGYRPAAVWVPVR